MTAPLVDLATAGVSQFEIVDGLETCVFPIFIGDDFRGNCFAIGENLVATSWHTFKHMFVLYPDDLLDRVSYGTAKAPQRFTRIFLYDEKFDIVLLETADRQLGYLPMVLAESEHIGKVVIASYARFPAADNKSTKYYTFDASVCRIAQDEKILWLDSGVNVRGQSGSPIYCLQRHAVVGMVNGVARSRVKLHAPLTESDDSVTVELLERGLVEGLSLTCLAQILGPQPSLYQAARACWDEAILRLNPHRAAILEQLQACTALPLATTPTPYVSRAAEEAEAMQFISNREPKNGMALLFSGNTGSGKSTLLRHLLQSLDPRHHVVFFLDCNENNPNDTVPNAVPRKPSFEGMSLDEVFCKLSGIALFDPQNAPLIKLFLRGRTLIFAIDEFNHFGCPHPDLAMDEFVIKVKAFWPWLGEQNAKVMFAIRSEFVRAFRPSYLVRFWRSQPANSGIEQAARPWIMLEELTPQQRKEMYSAYAKAAQFQHCLDYDQLPTTVSQLLTRPGYFPVFMQLYKARDVSRSTPASDAHGRFGLLHLLGTYLDVPSYAFLRQLARLAFDGQNEYVSSDTLATQENHQTADLLENSCIFIRIKKQREYLYKFSLEWMFEWFLADCFLKNNNVDQASFICGLPQQFVKAKKEQHLAAVLFNMVMLQRNDQRQADASMLIQMFNLEDPIPVLHEFVKYLLDAAQEDYHLEHTPLTSEYFIGFLFGTSWQLSQAGAERLLGYVELLEQDGEYSYGHWLLSLPQLIWPEMLPANLALRKQLSMAYHLLFLGRKSEAQEILQHQLPVTATQERHLEEKRRFLLGRVLQFMSQFTQASEIYRLEWLPNSKYGILSQHQLAFCVVLECSDFRQAASLLETILSTEYDFKLNLAESELLMATCQIRLGQYAKALKPLCKLIKTRHQMRHKHKEATARRALADLYLCTFRGAKALDQITRSRVLLDGIKNNASLIYALDLEAQIRAFLLGQVQASLEAIDLSINLAEKEFEANMHLSSLSWSRQTRQLLLALDGRTKTGENHLNTTNFSPYQHYRQRFIELIEKINAGPTGNDPPSLIEQAQVLLFEANDRGWGWYPVLLQIILDELSTHLKLKIRPSAASATCEAWRNSPVCQRLVAATSRFREHT